VRLDSAIYAGYSIPPYYDSLIGKLIVHGRDRAECVARLKRSLGEMVVGGIDTTIPAVPETAGRARHPQSGDYDIHWLENWAAPGPRPDRARLQRRSLRRLRPRRTAELLRDRRLSDGRGAATIRASSWSSPTSGA
jgi:acetyl/propionyl-CoA carboxylase alpha subunit